MKIAITDGFRHPNIFQESLSGKCSIWGLKPTARLKVHGKG